MQQSDYYEVKKTSVVTPNGEHKRKDTTRSKSNKRQKPELPKGPKQPNPISNCHHLRKMKMRGSLSLFCQTKLNQHKRRR